MLNGDFISDFKTALAISIYKKGNVIELSNYCPIDLHCMMSEKPQKLAYSQTGQCAATHFLPPNAQKLFNK